MVKKKGKKWYFTTPDLAMMSGLSRQAIFEKVKLGKIRRSPLSKKGQILIEQKEAERFLSKFPVINNPFLDGSRASWNGSSTRNRP